MNSIARNCRWVSKVALWTMVTLLTAQPFKAFPSQVTSTFIAGADMSHLRFFEDRGSTQKYPELTTA